MRKIFNLILLIASFSFNAYSSNTIPDMEIIQIFSPSRILNVALERTSSRYTSAIGENKIFMPIVPESLHNEELNWHSSTSEFLYKLCDNYFKDFSKENRNCIVVRIGIHGSYKNKEVFDKYCELENFFWSGQSNPNFTKLAQSSKDFISDIIKNKPNIKEYFYHGFFRDYHDQCQSQTNNFVKKVKFFPFNGNLLDKWDEVIGSDLHTYIKDSPLTQAMFRETGAICNYIQDLVPEKSEYSHEVLNPDNQKKDSGKYQYFKTNIDRIFLNSSPTFLQDNVNNLDRIITAVKTSDTPKRSDDFKKYFHQSEQAFYTYVMHKPTNVETEFGNQIIRKIKTVLVNDAKKGLINPEEGLGIIINNITVDMASYRDICQYCRMTFFNANNIAERIKMIFLSFNDNDSKDFICNNSSFVIKASSRSTTEML